MGRRLDRGGGIAMTQRLRLVPVGPEHVGDLVLLHRDPDVAWWNGGAWTAAQAATWAAHMYERWVGEGVGKWIAYRSSDGVLIGRGGLTWTELNGRRCLELGWALRDAHRGLGYATEIGRAGLDLAFDTLNADEVVAFTEVHNHASRAVMTRLGMTRTDTIRRPGRIDGQEGVHRSAPFALYRISWTAGSQTAQPGGPAPAQTATIETGR